MSRTRQIALGGGGLALAALAIWARDRRWLDTPADTLPLALGLPLAWFLGHPWIPRAEPLPGSPARYAAIGGAALALGWILGSLTVLTLSWTLLAMIWAHWSFTSQPRRGRLAWLLVCAFPWLVIDWPAIGWAFRLSSAAVAEQLFNFLQLPTQRDGTRIVIMGVPVEIEAACAGWNLLQLTLLAGVAFGTCEIRPLRRFALLLGLLPAISWLANLLRILILAGLALGCDAPVASGALHGLTGLAVLAAVLAMTKGLCVLLDPPPPTTSRTIQAS